MRGRGLLNAIVVDPNAGVEAWDICLKLQKEGLLTKPTHRCATALGQGLLLVGWRRLAHLLMLQKHPSLGVPRETCPRLDSNGCRNIIRLAPPLVITEEQLHEATGVIKKVFASL